MDTRFPTDATTVLVADPPVGAAEEPCRGLCLPHEASSVLYVVYTAEERTRVRHTASAAELGVVTVGGDRAVDPTGHGDHHEHVPTPSDLSGLGAAIDEVLTLLDGPVTICLDSVTAMTQYVEFATAYRFLHTLTSEVHGTTARVHLHVDPQAHDEQSLSALTSLVRARLSVADGVVRTRPN